MSRLSITLTDFELTQYQFKNIYIFLNFLGLPRCAILKQQCSTLCGIDAISLFKNEFFRVHQSFRQVYKKNHNFWYEYPRDV